MSDAIEVMSEEEPRQTLDTNGMENDHDSDREHKFGEQDLDHHSAGVGIPPFDHKPLS